MEPVLLIFAFLGIALGGVLKGATGAGAPVVGVPVLAVIFDVPMAVAIFAVLNVISNTWQTKTFYNEIVDRRFAWSHAVAAAVGVVPGSILLATLPTEVLTVAMAAIVFLYIALRLTRPDWSLSREQGRRFGPSLGFVGGLMQGAGGVSAPVSVSFLNALRLSRVDFIGTISVFFLAMASLQIPTLIVLGILSWERAGLALLAVIPLFFGITVGAWIARRLSKEAFDRVVLALLAVIAVKLLWDAFI
ncbi:MAG: sulfite exporter TauE/SafE family protein [Boseongicola sp.]|nr:sulfite exporter TauE/SafE family protein [Boseongicola sp.]NNJ67300.1 sulfite exporter TauE/SafE family protein [Boseongicola sp.]